MWRLPLPGAVKDGLAWCGAATNSCSPSARSAASCALPSALRRCTVAGAALHEGVLRDPLRARSRAVAPRTASAGPA